MSRLLVLLALVLAARAATAQSHDGTLAADDATLTSGEFADDYSVDLRAGETLWATLSSDDFDTWVIVKDDRDRQEDNDDCTTGDTHRSCVAFTADHDGAVRVIVTTYRPGEAGAYRVDLSTGDGHAGPASTSGAATPNDR